LGRVGRLHGGNKFIQNFGTKVSQKQTMWMTSNGWKDNSKMQCGNIK